MKIVEFQNNMFDYIKNHIPLNRGDCHCDMYSNCPDGPESILIDKTEQVILNMRRICNEHNLNILDHKNDIVSFRFTDRNGNVWEPMQTVATNHYEMGHRECKSTVEDFLINKRGKEFIHWTVFNYTTIYNQDAMFNELEFVTIEINFSHKDSKEETKLVEDRGGFKFL